MKVERTLRKKDSHGLERTYSFVNYDDGECTVTGIQERWDGGCVVIMADTVTPEEGNALYKRLLREGYKLLPPPPITYN